MLSKNEKDSPHFEALMAAIVKDIGMLSDGLRNIMRVINNCFL